jgi:hypothetical protein
MLNGFLSKISGEISGNLDKDAEKLKLWLIEVFSTVIFMGISTETYTAFSNYSFKEPENRKLLVLNLLERF